MALLERERDEVIDDLKRVAADFDNYRKRARATRRRWSRAPTSGS